MYVRLPLLVFYSAVFALVLLGNGYSVLAGDDHAQASGLRGFNWYSEDKAKKTEKLNGEADSNSTSERQFVNDELPEYEKNIRDLKDRYEQAHRRALDNPTYENILAEMRLEKQIMDKSEHYGKRRVAVAMMNSEFNDMASHSNILHRRVQDQLEAREDSKNLRELAKDWGLIVQVDDDCMHCHTFAPIILDFAKEYGFELLAASNSGEDFEGIEGVIDRGQMVAFNPGRDTPILYLVKSDGSEVIPIARGIHAAEQIVSNIKMIDRDIRKLF